MQRQEKIAELERQIKELKLEDEGVDILCRMSAKDFLPNMLFMSLLEPNNIHKTEHLIKFFMSSVNMKFEDDDFITLYDLKRNK